MSNDDSLSDYLCCPVCFEAPEAKVFQCKEGHVICEKCYIKLTRCPECRTPYDPANPIRSRASEAIRDRVNKFDCSFKSNGCQKRFRRNDEVKTHQAVCHFDFETFGKFINLCKLVGFTQCDFQVNKGNSKEYVEHLISEHNCISTKKRQFNMNLVGMKKMETPDYSDSINFWTPIIINLQKEQCYLLTMALHNQKDNSISWFSIHLPCHKEEGMKDDAAGIQLNYALSNESDLARPCPYWSFVQSPITLSNAELLLPSQLPWAFNESKLKGYYARGGSVLISIQCILNGCKAGSSPGKMHRLLRYHCSKNTFTFTPGNLLAEDTTDSWNLEQGSWAGKSILRQTRNDCIEDRRKCLRFLERLFGPNCMANGLSLTDLEWLRNGSLFLTAEVGDVPAIKYLLEKSRLFPSSIKITRVTSNFGNTAIFETFKDKDKKLGLEKARILVEHGASIRIVTNSGDNLLHWAAKFGNIEALKYFSKKGLDINAKNFNDEAPMHFTFRCGDKAIRLQSIKFLLKEAGVPLETTGVRNRSLLHYSARISAGATEYFLGKGLNVNGRDEDGLTPLHRAVENLNKDKEEFVKEIVKILLANGADKSLKTKIGVTPLNFVSDAYKNVQKLLK